MQQVDRRGVMIDICRDCRGVYLDRGELDKLLEDPSPVEVAPPAGQPNPLAGEADRLGRPDYRERYDEDDDDRFRDEGGGRGRGRRGRGGWLGDMFDLD